RTDIEYLGAGDPKHYAFGFTAARREFAQPADSPLFDRVRPDVAGWNAARRRFQYGPQLFEQRVQYVQPIVFRQSDAFCKPTAAPELRPRDQRASDSHCSKQ